MSVDRYDYDITYDVENGRYEVEAIKCDDGAMVSFDHYAKQAERIAELTKQLEKANERIKELEEVGRLMVDSGSLTKQIGVFHRAAKRFEALSND